MSVYAERYFRTWERDGRRQLDGKLALAFDDYDERRSSRLGALDWDEHHATYDPDYEFSTVDITRDETGAWTVDDDTKTIAALRERDIEVPNMDTVPLALDVNQRRMAEVDRTCPACHHDRLCSKRDVEGAYPPAERGTAMQAFLDSEQGTHMCVHCRRFFDIQVTSTQSTRDVGVDLSEAM